MCTIKVKGNGPLHKVTIVRVAARRALLHSPRGRPLSVTRVQLEANLARISRR